MLDKLKIIFQYILPKNLLTQLAGWGADCRAGWLLTRIVLKTFVRIYKIDMQEAQQPDLATYSTFNEFFTRPLRKEARPINTDPNILVMPADGVLSQFGHINGHDILQAKGHSYNLKALLAGDDKMVTCFTNGDFITTYLSPRDYHRVHMPCNGVLRKMLYVPGKLFPVNSLAAASIPNLFARNERVICLFDTDFGPMALILLGATIVGSIETAWFGTVVPPREGIIKSWRYPHLKAEGSILLLKGQEMGRFKLGSTVISLFSSGHIVLEESLHLRKVTRVGQRLAKGLVLDDNSILGVNDI